MNALPSPTRVLRLIQVPLVVALFALLVWRIDVGAVRRALEDADARYVVAVVLLNLPVGLLFALRSHIALRRLGYRVRPGLLIPIAVLGNVAGALTPASSGEVLRAGALNSRAGVPLKDAAGLVLFERALSLFYMALGTIAIGAYLVLPAAPATALLVPFLALAFAPAAAPLVRTRSDTTNRDHEGIWQRVFIAFLDALGRSVDIARDSRALTGCISVTLTIFAVQTAQFWLLARSITPVVSFQEAWVALGASQLAGILSLIPFGLGASDWSLAAILRRFGITLEQGTAVAVLVRGATTLPLLLMAFASYLVLATARPAPARDAARDGVAMHD